MAFLALAFVLCETLTSCHRRSKEEAPTPQHAAYFWRTQFNLTPEDSARIAQDSIECLYTRFFDVVNDAQGSHPNATISFNKTAPKGIKIIPVVFVENDCLLRDYDNTLSTRIVARVLQMCETHHITADELQIDCDWTQSSRKTFHAFIKAIRQALDDNGAKTWRLSATIRLHQLQQEVPPALDYGVLMLYNTGDLRTTERNPILSYDDVVPYLKHLRNYNLPLSAAYPRFSMPLLFCGKELKAVLYDENLADTTLYKRTSDTTYEVVQSRNLPLSIASGNHQVHVHPGERVIVWQSDEAEIRKVREAIDSIRTNINHHIIHYPL